MPYFRKLCLLLIPGRTYWNRTYCHIRCSQLVDCAREGTEVTIQSLSIRHLLFDYYYYYLLYRYRTGQDIKVKDIYAFSSSP